MEIRRVVVGEEALVAGLTEDRAEAVGAFVTDSDNWLFLAIEQDEPVGLAVAYRMLRHDGRSMVCLYELEVRRDARLRGVGTALVNAVLSAAAAAKAYKTWVLADVENEAARRTYVRAGGRASGQVLFTWTIRPS